MEEQNVEPIQTDTTTKIPDNLFGKVFTWMFMGLLATGLIAVYTYKSGLYANFLFDSSLIVLLIVEVVVVLLFSFLFKKLPPTVVMILFFVYAAINGVTMSVIFVVFELSSILYSFFAAVALFGIFAIYGYKTKASLVKVGKLFLWTLLIAVIVSIVNIFLGFEIVDIVLDWIILFLFFGITAYDMQKIKLLAMSDNFPVEKLHIYGAMELYLDFINIFLRILSIFGQRKD